VTKCINFLGLSYCHLITNKSTGKALAGLRPNTLSLSAVLEVIMHIKFLVAVILIDLCVFHAQASVPRECSKDESIIIKGLSELAENAKVYIKENGELPGVWSHGVSQIISASPTAIKVGGNIDPGEDGKSMTLTCSDLKTKIDSVYSINIYSLIITKSENGPVRSRAR
ncbi:hypothetical protein, partial [Aliiglaciecola aliphaticivorans]